MSPLPNDLGQGASGFHGDAAVRVRQLLQQIDTVVPAGADDLAAFAAKYNAMLLKLDNDAGVTDADYVALHAVS